ncbi:MAG: DUF4190 domain-containing protein [Flavobacteriia bacterium]|nr:DUF4190 domain-containing protein [Flavobacteriia bacterium]
MEEIIDIENTNTNNLIQKSVPNAVPVLVLGIVSIVGCLFYALPGIICGIIALVLHKKDKYLYEENQAQYEVSFKTSKAGKVCGIIGLSLSILYLIILVIAFTFIFKNGPMFRYK